MRLKNIKIIAVIPARSGSETIKNKNIILHKGRPLIYHSIKLALNSKMIDRVIVSTDSKKYANLSKKTQMQTKNILLLYQSLFVMLHVLLFIFC